MTDSPSSHPHPAAPGGGRRQLLLIVGLFALPMLIAGVLAAIGYMPEGRKAYGEVLTPAKPLPETAITVDGQAFPLATPQWFWTMVVRVPKTCDATCVERLNLIPNLRETLNRRAEKLRFAILDPLPPGVTAFAGLRGVYYLQQFPAELNTGLPQPETDLRLGLVDPSGYFVMRFPEHAELKPVRRDLGKLVL
ncbi:hypothetical protein C7S18_17530 [Ahniella affigens]|uniref:Cytochrome oxidase assembly protein n=1 Tax=Ahniella affigens TaxID=2021234 RepID=A0A2P1PVI6_9GAMM|nr:hypothetical protein [Ahniella affigens]AVP98867.1 hypothetical protein C7S18_17530 [Ahniella affigens]